MAGKARQGVREAAKAAAAAAEAKLQAALGAAADAPAGLMVTTLLHTGPVPEPQPIGVHVGPPAEPMPCFVQASVQDFFGVVDQPATPPRTMSAEDIALFFGVGPMPVVELPPATPAEPPRPTAEDRENPNKLTGDALRALANRRGIARSDAAAMSDEKLRMQLRYLTARQAEEETA